MKKNEMMNTTNNTALSNSELNTKVESIRKAVELGITSTWVQAKAYFDIVSDELYDDDFANLADFASYMGVSKALISQYTKAWEYYDNNTGLFEFDRLTVGKTYILSTLKEQAVEFKNWCVSNNRDIYSMTDAGLKGTIKDWKNELEAVEVEATEDTEAVEQDAEAVEQEEIIRIEYNGNIYDIPATVLEQYKVEK